MDDIIITWPSLDAIQALKNFLQSRFQLEDLGELKYFLSLEIAKSSKGIVIYQRHYTLQLLEDTDFLGSKPIHILMHTKIKLNDHDGELLSDASQYRHLITRLLYLTSIPDITFAVYKLSQYLSKPHVPHLQAIHHLICYVKSKPGQDCFFSYSSSLQIKAFFDAD